MVGLFLKYVGFEIDITGEKWLQILMMPPTDHQIWQVPNDKDDLNQHIRIHPQGIDIYFRIAAC